MSLFGDYTTENLKLSDVAKSYRVLYKFIQFQKEFEKLAKILAPKGININPAELSDPTAFMKIISAFADEHNYEDVIELLDKLEKIGDISFEEIHRAISIIEHYLNIKMRVEGSLKYMIETSSANQNDIMKFAKLLGFKMPGIKEDVDVDNETEDYDNEDKEYITKEDLEFINKIKEKLKNNRPT